MLNLIKTEKIESFIKENNMSINEFCEGSKISYCVYRRIMGQKNFMLSALFKVAKFMNVHVHELCSNKRPTKEEISEFKRKYAKLGKTKRSD